MNISLENKLTINFWINRLKLCPIVNDNPLTLYDSNELIIKKEELPYFKKLTANNEILGFTVLFAIYNILLQRYFETVHFVASSGLAKNKQILLYGCQTIERKTFKQCLNEAKEEIKEVFKYSNFDEQSISKKPFCYYTSFGFSYNRDYKKEKNNFPFYLIINKKEEGITITISYDENFTTEYVANHILGNVKRWLINLENFINEEVTNLPIIFEQEREELLYSFNNTKVEYPNFKTIVNLFEEQAKKTPNNVAVVYNEEEYSYTYIDKITNQLAHYLRDNHDVGIGDFIGVKLERDVYLVVVILAILKTGSAYVPIDIDYPKKRIKYIEEDCQCRLVFDSEELLKFKNKSVKYSESKINTILDKKNLAYLIYTSGTTGNPKGVMITHGNVTELIRWSQNEFNGIAFEIIYAATSHCFDLSVFEMFYPLSVGKTLRILKNALSFGDYLPKDNGILLNTVPSVIRTVFDNGYDLQNVSIINLAGESFPVDIANKLSTTTIVVKNLYGPSEDTTYSTVYTLEKRNYEAAIPIGRPIANTQAFVLDIYLNPVPIGVIGKLYLSGSGISNGYLNNPKLTKKNFSQSPFDNKKRMYDTGDLARWTSKGILEFFGRKDNQVKLRGYRIELEEIEHKFLQFSTAIKDIVVAVKTVDNISVLVGYFISNELIDKKLLREFLESKLPSYMVPTYLLKINTIPLSPNGKVNRDILTNPTLNNVIRRSFVAPRDQQERLLVEIWENVIGVSPIGIEDHFFELGGHSLMILQIINAIYKELNFSVSYQLFYKNPTIKELKKSLKSEDFTPIIKAKNVKKYKVAPSQRRIWLLNQFEGGNKAYQISGGIIIEGDLNHLFLVDSVKELINCHEILRTFFLEDHKGELYQEIIPYEDFSFDIKKIDFSKNEFPNVAAKKYISKQLSIELDLVKQPLFEVVLIKIKENQVLFYLSMHHIIGDGWSIEILIQELFVNYNQLSDNGYITKEKNKIQYKDYTEWLSSQKVTKSYIASKKYWLREFKEAVPVLIIPGYHKRPKIKTYNGGQINYKFSSGKLEELKKISKKQKVTLFTVLLSSLKTILYRYSKQEEICIGTPVAGRNHPDLENQIGLYINTLPIKSVINSKHSFAELLSNEGDSVLNAFDNQQFLFDELIESINLERDTSRSPLFDVLMVLQNQQQLVKFKNSTSDLSIQPFNISRESAQFDLTFAFKESDALEVEINYNTDIYDYYFVNRLKEHLEIVFDSVIKDINVSIQDIELITEEEDIVLQEFNKTEKYLVTETLVDKFRTQAKETPDIIAVEFKNKKLSYLTLDTVSNRLANYLISKYQIKTGDLIVIKLPRSENLIISILGVLKSGGAYVPLDCDTPTARVKTILKDTKAKIVIDEFFIKTFNQNSIEDKVTEFIKVKNTDIAYVIFTSGTTGKPKGVVITHKNVINFLEAYDLKSARTSLTCNIVFDVSVMEIFAPITSGNTLIIPDKEIIISPQLYANFLYENEITHCYIHPMFIEEMGQELNKYDTLFLERILIGVEGIKKKSITWYFDKKIEIYNGYGPTEATICSTFYKVNSLEEIRTVNLPIGKPLPNYKIHIINYNSDILEPIGMIGELCISGVGLSKAYLNDDNLTRQKFIINPFNKNEKLYRTGDLARWLSDGNIEFIGRKDTQIKLNGYRIELKEIEYYALLFDKNITQVLAIVNKSGTEIKLILYYTASNEITTTELRLYFKKQLPSYMIPQYYIPLDNFPMTKNGKIDRELLPKIHEQYTVQNEYAAPQTEREIKIVAIWNTLLKSSRIGVNDDFFELGGNSLMLSKLLIEYQREFQKTIPLKKLYNNTDLKSHATIIEKDGENIYEIEKVKKQDYYNISPSQKRYWLIYKIKGKSKEFNIYNTITLHEMFNREAFDYAFNVLQSRHQILNTIFVENNGIPQQKIVENEKTSILYCNTAEEAKVKIFEHKFDLETFPLFKIAIVPEGAEHLLFFNIHHSISDGWSMDIIHRELLEIYKAKIENRKADLPKLSISYRDYAQWQHNTLTASEVTKEERYWKEKLSGNLTYLQLPIDYTVKLKKETTISGSYKVFLSKTQKNKIEELSKNYGVSVFTVFVAMLKILLYKLTSSKDICIGIPAANRQHYQLKDIVGCFINTLILRNKIDEKQTFKEWIKTVSKTLNDALIHQNYPFEEVLDKLNIPQKEDRFPVTPVFLNMTDFEANIQEKIKDFTIKHEDINAIPKFDLEFYIKSYENGFSFECVYDKDLFSENTIEYWTDSLLKLLNKVEQNLEKSIASIEAFEVIKAEEEYHKPNNEFSYFDSIDIEQSIVKRFENKVIENENLMAIYANGVEFTYKQLNNCANHLARQLGENNKIQRTALLLTHDETCVIGILGVLKSGDSYVPIDINNPIDRIKFIIEDSGCSRLVYNAKTENIAIRVLRECPNIELVELKKENNLSEIENLEIKITPDSEAYILYTSGSTGKPKGVIQNQRNVLHFVKVYTNNIHLANYDNLSLFSTYTFDASIKDIFGALLNGAKLSFYNVVNDGIDHIYDWLEKQNITVMHMVPTLYRSFLKELKKDTIISTVRLIDLGGESCHKIDIELFKKHFKRGAFIVNDYGPTESTIVAQNFLNHDSLITRNNISLGRAVTETEFFILGEDNLKKGAYGIGEIVFKSNYLSLGYLNRSELTQKSFLTDPTTGKGQIYRSGDIGMQLPNGEIEFLYRKDSQVKLNGLRIELDEIIYQLEKQEKIIKAVVQLKEINTISYLTAYIKTKDLDLVIDKVKEKLSHVLPKYMIPSVYIIISDFSLTRTGKIDKNKLPNPTISDLKTKPYVAPNNEIEKELVKIWSSILKLEETNIGVDDSFFELGGNSLKIAPLINTINNQLEITLQTIDIFQYPTIKTLTEKIENNNQNLTENFETNVAVKVDDLLNSI